MVASVTELTEKGVEFTRYGFLNRMSAASGMRPEAQGSHGFMTPTGNTLSISQHPH